MVNSIRCFYSFCAMLCLLLLGDAMGLQAQRKPLDEAALRSWPEIMGEKISGDGRYVLYSIYTRATGPRSEWYVKSTDNSWQRALKNAAQPAITADNRYVVYIKGGDSVVVYDPVSDVQKAVLPGNSYQLSAEAENLLLACGHRTGKLLRVYDFRHETTRTYTGVEQFELAANGCVLAAVTDSAGSRWVKYVDLNNNSQQVIASGGNRFTNFSFDAPATQLAFIEEAGVAPATTASLRYFKKGMDSAIVTVAPGLEKGYALQPLRPRFNTTGTKLFFTVNNKASAPAKDPNKAEVNIWHYKDVNLPTEQAYQLTLLSNCLAVVSAGDGAIIQLSRRSDNPVSGNYWQGDAQYVIVSNRYNVFSLDSSAANTPSHYLVNTSTGERTLLVAQKDNAPVLSAGGRFAVWYDYTLDSYMAYDIKTGRKRNITPGMQGMLKPAVPNGRLYANMPYGMAGWLPGDSALLIYDQYDVWKVDVLGLRPAVNLTKGYGRTHQTILRIWHADASDYEASLIGKSTVLLCAFETTTKRNGFYSTSVQAAQQPVKLTMDDCLYYAHGRFNNSFLRSANMCKAAGADVYLLHRTRADQYPDLLVTSNFKQFIPLTHLQPEAAYNWVKAELARYALPDGRSSAAVLYKPTDFDSTKKYPVIFYFYEKLSYRLHQYLPPATSDGSLNIPYLVSNGYIICTPDIEYKKGWPGVSALEYVTAAANYVGKLPYVDAKKMGIQGHSFGGYQVNYIVAKTNLFAAAQSSAGASDLLSYYNGHYRESSAQFYWEVGQGRIGHTFWQKPEQYQQNSPIYFAPNVTTPLLLMHSKDDGEVPFQQGLEWFTALRRLGKKVWLLQYDKEYHGLVQPKNMLDFTIRMKQFFDHYLKGAPMPVWMRDGIPASMKGVEDGY